MKIALERETIEKFILDADSLEEAVKLIETETAKPQLIMCSIVKRGTEPIMAMTMPTPLRWLSSHPRIEDS